MYDFLFWGFYNLMLRKDSTAFSRASLLLSNLIFFQLFAIALILYKIFKPDISPYLGLVVIAIGYIIMYINELYFIKKGKSKVLMERFITKSKGVKVVSMILALCSYILTIAIVIYIGIGIR